MSFKKNYLKKGQIVDPQMKSRDQTEKLFFFHTSKIIFLSLAPDKIQKISADFFNKISFSGSGCAMSSMQMLRAIMQSTFPFCPNFLLEMFPSHVSRHEFCTHCQRNTLSKSNKNDTLVQFMSFARASNDEFRVECLFWFFQLTWKSDLKVVKTTKNDLFCVIAPPL